MRMVGIVGDLYAGKTTTVIQLRKLLRELGYGRTVRYFGILKYEYYIDLNLALLGDYSTELVNKGVDAFDSRHLDYVPLLCRDIHENLPREPLVLWEGTLFADPGLLMRLQDIDVDLTLIRVTVPHEQLYQRIKHTDIEHIKRWIDSSHERLDQLEEWFTVRSLPNTTQEQLQRIVQIVLDAIQEWT